MCLCILYIFHLIASKDSGPPLDPRMSATMNERGDIVSFGEDYDSDEDFSSSSSSSDDDERMISYKSKY